MGGIELPSIVPTIAAFSTDGVVIAVLFAIAIIDAMASGGARATAAAFALPISGILLAAIPGAAFLGSLNEVLSTEYFQGIFILGMTIVLGYLISRITMSVSLSGAGTGAIFGAIVALATVGIILTTWEASPALRALYDFGPIVSLIFGEAYRFMWLLGGYLALAVARR